MALGDQGKALRIASIAQGWDPNKIEGGGDISDFNAAPDPAVNRTTVVGRLPAVPEGQADFQDATESPLSERVSWQVSKSGPSAQQGVVRKTSDPYPGSMEG